MKQSILITTLAFIFATLFLRPVDGYAAGDGNFDSRVHIALVQEGVQFRHENGDFLSRIETVGGRGQMVIVNSDTEKKGEYEYREVCSIAYMGEPLNERRLEELLVNNAKLSIGGWRVQTEDLWVVVFSVRIAADADGPTIKSAMAICALMADQLEKEWTRTDQF